jgi:hypothetical protein
MMGLPAAAGAVDKPAQVSGIEFPGRAVFLPAVRALIDIPAFFGGIVRIQDPGQQKQNLPFHMVGNSAPPLLIAVNGLDGNTQQLGHLFLRFFQPGSGCLEVVRIHSYFNFLMIIVS